MLLLVDHQPQMAFATSSIDAIELRNNVALIANAARVFGVATILATVAERTFSGPLFEEIRQALPDVEVTDRTTTNAWEDQAIIQRVNGIGD
jgi:nicotinamidase-related amidase